MIQLTRRYRLAAAHVLASEELSDEENRRIFGKCANPAGHGHDYGVEVTVEGPIDAVTGQVIEHDRLDRLFEASIADRLDHRFLNDLELFEGRVPTAEVIAQVVHAELGVALAAEGRARLAHVRLVETPNNDCEYGD